MPIRRLYSDWTTELAIDVSLAQQSGHIGGAPWQRYSNKETLCASKNAELISCTEGTIPARRGFAHGVKLEPRKTASWFSPGDCHGYHYTSHHNNCPAPYRWRRFLRSRALVLSCQ